MYTFLRTMCLATGSKRFQGGFETMKPLETGYYHYSQNLKWDQISRIVTIARNRLHSVSRFHGWFQLIPRRGALISIIATKYTVELDAYLPARSSPEHP